MSQCDKCQGDNEELLYCDFCTGVKSYCHYCIESDSLFSSGWKCCLDCYELIVNYASQEDLTLSYDNVQTFMDQIGNK